MPAQTPAVTVWASAALPGFHRWPDAPPQREYLAARHRHLFRVTAHVAAGHDDRDTEFHDLQDLIRAWWGAGPRECGDASCETIARALAGHLGRAALRVVQVEVSEDGENGAIVALPPP